jgi:hypothetical protein
VFWPFLLHVRAQACQRAGRLEDGLGAVREGLAVAPQLADLHIVHGDLLRDSRDPAAEEAYSTALDLAHGWGARTSELRAAVRLCQLEAPARILEDRRARLRSIVETFAEGLGAPDVLAARTLLTGE